MAKNKKPVPRKSSAPSAEDVAEATIQKLCDLALELVEQEEPDQLREQDAEFHKTIRKLLLQKRDEVLYEALERARYADEDAWRLLRGAIEEASEAVVFRRDDGHAVEVDAFSIPFFVRSTGGLDAAECFGDQEAFDQLTASLKASQLESAQAQVVLVAHAYHLDEIDRITYSQINEMARDAQASMSGRKASTLAIEKSLSGWPPKPFGAADAALELRFLVGFALKPADDPFYAVPADEAAADAYFAEREQRFQRWTEVAAPLLARCLAREPGALELSFLYQDMFHGAKQRGIAEQAMLVLMSQVRDAIEAAGMAPDEVDAIIGPATVGEHMVLRVNLLARTDGRVLASLDNAVGESADFEAEFMDSCDCVLAAGIASLALASGFDATGAALETRPYDPA